MGMIQTSTEADLLVEFSQWGTLLHTIIDGFHSDAILLKRFPLEDPNEITKDWLSPAFDPISLDTFPAEVIERIAENMSEINQKSRSRRRVRIIFRRKSQNSKVKKSRLEEEIEEETKYLDGPHSTVTCNKGQIFPSLISAIRTSSNWITSICLANVKLMAGCMSQLTYCSRLKNLCFHEMTIDMTTSSVEEKSGKLLCFMEELHMFTDWANGHLDAFGLSRAPSLLFKAVSNCNGNGRNSASPYRMCLSAQTFELLGGNNGYRYDKMLTKNSGFDLHFMLYGRTDHMSTNTSAFALLLTAGGVRIRSLEIHCRIDPIPRSILSCLVFLTNLKSLSGITKLLVAGELTWIARSCPQLEELRIHKSCSEVPTDDYRSVAMYWHNLRSLCLSKAIHLSRANFAALVNVNPHLKLVYLENCKKLGGLHFQLEGVAVWSTDLSSICQLEMVDCGRLTVTSVNSLIQNCSKTLIYASFRGVEVYVDQDQIDDKASEAKGWRFIQPTRKFPDSNVKHFIMLKQADSDDIPTIEPEYNICSICRTTMIEF